MWALLEVIQFEIRVAELCLDGPQADSLVSGKGEICQGRALCLSPPTSAWLINPCRWLYQLPRPKLYVWADCVVTDFDPRGNGLLFARLAFACSAWSAAALTF